MDWNELFEEAGLSDREAKSLVILSSSKELKASDLAKKLGTNRLDAYNSLSRLTQIGLVNVTADRPMKFSCSSFRGCLEYQVLIVLTRLFFLSFSGLHLNRVAR